MQTRYRQHERKAGLYREGQGRAGQGWKGRGRRTAVLDSTRSPEIFSSGVRDAPYSVFSPESWWEGCSPIPALFPGTKGDTACYLLEAVCSVAEGGKITKQNTQITIFCLSTFVTYKNENRCAVVPKVVTTPRTAMTQTKRKLCRCQTKEKKVILFVLCVQTKAKQATKILF